MKSLTIAFVIFALAGCAFSDQARIENHKKRCELIGFKKDTTEFRNCVFEFEKQVFTRTTSRQLENTSSTSQSTSTKSEACLYNPTNQRNETCYHVMAGGSCAHFGAPCTP